MNVLVTGAAGYLGSHFIFKALENEHRIIGIDNFSNSSENQIKIIRKNFPNNFKFIKCDVTNLFELQQIFETHKVDIVVHFAALKSVHESIDVPETYYLNNLGGTKNLLNAMKKNNVTNIIFSSTAAVYGDSLNQPVSEDVPLNPISPYGETKKLCEQEIIQEVKNSGIKAVILRYFNPIGFNKYFYHISKKVFQDNSLIGNILSVATGRKGFFEIYGDQYNTKDGTAERDFIHINDLIESHFLAVNFISDVQEYEIFNVGTGQPFSVKDFLETFIMVNKIQIPIRISSNRGGDVESSYTNTEKIIDMLSFKPKHDLEDMCKDSWEIFKT